MAELTTYLPGILLAYSAFLISIMSPGPNILAIIGTSMAAGRGPGLALGAGVGLGSICWATLTVTGLSALIAAYAEVLFVIKIIGGCYLLFLAFKAFKSAASRHDIEATTLKNAPKRTFGYLRRGFIIQMTNPKAALAWIAIISLGLQAGAPWWVAVVIVAGTGILSLSIHALYALAFSSDPMVRAYGKARRWIQAALGTFFAIAGLKLLTSRT